VPSLLPMPAPNHTSKQLFNYVHKGRMSFSPKPEVIAFQWVCGCGSVVTTWTQIELELGLIQTHVVQKLMLQVEG